MRYDEATRTVALDPFPDNPKQKLAKRKWYDVIITAGVKDKAGNTLGGGRLWSFKTGRR